MKKTVLTLLMTVSVAMYADELTTDVVNAQPVSKLEQIQKTIDKYEKLINALPEKLQGKIKNFDRLKTIGTKVETVLRSYVAASNECVNELHSPLGEAACRDMAELDLGSEIKKEKSHVNEMIIESERELEQVKNEQKDLPAIKKLLDSLKSTKQMLMREGY